MDNDTSLLAPGSYLRDRWEIVKKVGGGGFGEIYKAEDHSHEPPTTCAVKVESCTSNKQVLKMEVAVLKRLQNSCIHICEFIGCGRNSKVNYVVMSLVGPNLSELRKRQPNQKFSISTTLRVGLQIISAVQAMHDCGFLHRDIKPSNFAIGDSPETARTCYMLDYGLSRQYTTVTGEVRQPRPVAGFRGTVRYASLNAHLSRDLGRHDDLWSVFYLLVELAIGQLPWRRIRDKEEAGECKAKYDHKKLIRGLPHEFNHFLEQLKSSSYYDKPDYAFTMSSLKDAIHRLGINEADPYDWEQDYSAPSMTTGSMVSPPAVKLNEDEEREQDKKSPSKTNCSDVAGMSDNAVCDQMEENKFLQVPQKRGHHRTQPTRDKPDVKGDGVAVEAQPKEPAVEPKNQNEKEAPAPLLQKSKTTKLGKDEIKISNEYASEGESREEAGSKERSVEHTAKGNVKENNNRLQEDPVGVAPAKSYQTESLNRFYDMGSHYAKDSPVSNSKKSSERDVRQDSYNVTSKYFSKKDTTDESQDPPIYPDDQNEEVARGFEVPPDNRTPFSPVQQLTCYVHEPSVKGLSESSQSSPPATKHVAKIGELGGDSLRKLIVAEDSSMSDSDSKRSIEVLFALKTQNNHDRTKNMLLSQDRLSSTQKYTMEFEAGSSATKTRSVPSQSLARQESAGKRLRAKSNNDVLSKVTSVSTETESEIQVPIIKGTLSEHTGKKKMSELRAEEHSNSAPPDRLTRSETNCLEILPTPMKILPRPPPNPPPLNYSRSLLARRRRFVRTTEKDSNHKMA